MKKMFIKKGDTVMVIAGSYKGQQGRVLSVNADKYKAVVEGVNMLSKHAKPSSDNPKGGIIKKEGLIHLSNLKLIDSSGKPGRIGRKIDDKTQKSVRYSKKTGEVIK
ncbi:MAG: 50S ribosomal protein L24 [Bacteroidales bacterium]|nr:50S ribosomal protein L24 [Bacteroidales bacterium]